MLFDSEWTSCGVGCQKLSPDPRFLRSVDRDVGYFDGTRFWFFLVQQQFGDIEGHYMVVLAASDGSVAGAWRAPNPEDPGWCVPAPFGVGDGHAVFGVQVGHRPDWPRLSPIYHASLDAIGTVDTPIATLTEADIGGEGLPQRVGVSASTVVLEVQPRGTVVAIEDGEISVIGGLGTALPGLPQQTQLVGRTAYWEDWDRHVRAAFGRVEETPALLREVEPDEVREFKANADAFSWLEARRFVTLGEYEVVELWTAPYVEDPAALAPRMVRAMPPFMQAATAGGGRYAQLTLLDVAVPSSQRIIAVYDLTDGRRRNFVPEGGRPVFDRPLAIGPDQMLVQVSWDDAVPGRALTIVDLSALPYVTE
jgi:hypothetical protein